MQPPDESALADGASPTDDFAHIQRHFDVRIKATVAILQPSDYYIGQPGEILSTVLGSCIAACIRDARLKIGGMNHFMLPTQGDGFGGAGSSSWSPTRFGDIAMPCLVGELLRRGAHLADLQVKLVGGAKVIDTLSDVGAGNIQFVRDYLRREGLRVLGEDLGDRYPRRVLYDPATGTVRVKRLPRGAPQQLAGKLRSLRDAGENSVCNATEPF